MTIEEFCCLHRPCSEVREWATENCMSLQHAWETARPEWVIWMATRPGVLSDNEIRTFAVWCARHVQHLMQDQRSLDAIETAERFANGTATAEDFTAVSAAAWDAAMASAMASALDAARAAAWDSTRAAAWDFAWDAASAAASAAQAQWLRENTKPDFGRVPSARAQQKGVAA